MEYKKYLTMGYESQLNNLPVIDSKLRFTIDTGRLFFDILGRRLEITDFVKGYSEDQIKSIFAPLPKVYLSNDTHRFLIHDGENWVCLNAAHSDTSDNATNASTATYSVNAGTAVYANKATNADTSEYAKYAANASTATYATNASTSVYSNKALNDTNGKQINTTYAPLASPILTGTPTVPTPATGNNSKQIANTEYVVAAIAAAIGEITKFDTEITTSLPETGVKGVIYFIPNPDPETQNEYLEYLWCNTKYEKIGSTKIDLSEYVNDIEVTGTGNAITGVTKSGNKLSYAKNATFLTKHPSVTSNSSTSSESPIGGGNFNVIDELEVDDNGHVTLFKLKNVQLPNSVNGAINADTATYANKSLNDNAGQRIDTTYIKNASVSGKIVTFTKGDGSTFTITTQDNNTTYANMSGATTTTNGSAGLVPAPSSGAANRYLRSDGTWVVPPDTNTTYTTMTGASSSAAGNAGLVPAPAKGNEEMFLRGDGTWDDFDYGDLDDE